MLFFTRFSGISRSHDDDDDDDDDDVVLRHTLPVFTGLGRAQLFVGTLLEQ